MERICRDYYLPSSKGQDYIATISAQNGVYRIVGKKLGEIDPEEGQIKVLRQFNIQEAPTVFREEIQKHRDTIIMYNEMHHDSTRPNNVSALLIAKLDEESISLNEGLPKALKNTIAVYVSPPEENQES